jgi:hypothetical protein
VDVGGRREEAEARSGKEPTAGAGRSRRPMIGGTSDEEVEMAARRKAWTPA